MKITIILCSLLLCGFSTTIAQKKILVITPHPDDAEASCGGLMANAVAAGDSVIILTMTGGEFGAKGKTPNETKALRIEEAKKAAAVLHTRVVFFGGHDAWLAVDTNTHAKLTAFIKELQPAVVLAPWPLDVHPDHQATGLLAWRVFQNKAFSFSLYFFETINEPHTKTFSFVPTDYIDITSVAALKKEALMQHTSQRPDLWYSMYETLATVRGYEADVKLAEAYVEAKNSSGMGGRSNKVDKVLK